MTDDEGGMVDDLSATRELLFAVAGGVARTSTAFLPFLDSWGLWALSTGGYVDVGGP